MSRDRSLDVLRGLFLIVISIDHFGGTLRTYTWQTFGFVSAAEGFIFLSGYMSGLVYGRPNYPDAVGHCLKRALQIYGFHMALVLCLVIVSATSTYYADYWRGYVPLFSQAPVSGLLTSAVLLYNPNFLSVLPLYIIFLLVTPLLLAAHRRGLSAAVLLISFLLWCAGQAGLRDALVSLLPLDPDRIKPGLFDVTTWQILFVAGNWLGYRRANHYPPFAVTSYTVTILSGLTLALLMAWRHGWVDYVPDLIAAGHTRPTLGWVRLVNFVILGHLFAALLKPRSGFARLRYPAFLGRHSLQVYSWSILLIFLLMPLSWRAHTADPLVDILACMAFIASLTIPARLHARFREATAVRRRVFTPSETAAIHQDS